MTSSRSERASTFVEPVASGDWLFTCRHTFEGTLQAQLRRRGVDAVMVGSGLVAARGLQDWALEGDAVDPTYALQVLPNVQPVRGQSVRELGQGLASRWADAIDGLAQPWALHLMVPGQLRGNPRAPMARRADLIREATLTALKRNRRRAVAWCKGASHRPVWLGQALLETPELLWASGVATRDTELGGTWPCALLAGLADVADDPLAPASSFRKLEEALSCMGVWPKRGDVAVDAGACPGGWTRVMRRYGAKVHAVDRQPLARHLMDDPLISFVKADAFTWTPPESTDWWVSDVVAYPERIMDMVQRVSTQVLPAYAVIQMKFQGAPDHDAVEKALTTLRAAGYGARARHFFNDKNEVTLMAVKRQGGDA